MGSGYIFGCSNCNKEDDPIECTEDGNNIKGTFFDIMTGGLMLCFCKKQLEEIYKTLESATNDEGIDRTIHENIKAGFNFTEILGYLPYYCETCEKLFNQFYLQMEKGKELYVPNYTCPKCKNTLEPVCPTWEKNNEGSWAQDLRKIKFKYNLYMENGIIQIKSHGKKKVLSCDYCNNEVFEIFERSFCD